MVKEVRHLRSLLAGSLLGVLIGMLLLQPVAAAPLQGAQFGETLQYNIHWTGFPAGRAHMTFGEGREGGAYQVDVGVRSTGMVELFYPVDDRVVVAGLFDKQGKFLTNSYEKIQNEGKRKRHTLLTFARAEKRAYQQRNQQKKRAIKNLPEYVVDPLSAFYALRARPKLEPGDAFYMPVLDSHKPYKARMKVVRREPRSTPLGWFDTLLVEVQLKKSDVFRQVKAIKVWLSDDVRRLPVRVETDIRIGFVAADLVAFDDARGEQRAMKP
uniref:DUF3108 domain-containing protein n=1 Tax=Magnetococcus massalia (strain MO-1) TaxID=451514 RepID=A0A1S7LEY0_MAGMO|nr:conserved exported protein of unknown function [Candidatus Magnetococcus massalia]